MGSFAAQGGRATWVALGITCSAFSHHSQMRRARSAAHARRDLLPSVGEPNIPAETAEDCCCLNRRLLSLNTSLLLGRVFFGARCFGANNVVVVVVVSVCHQKPRAKNFSSFFIFCSVKLPIQAKAFQHINAVVDLTEDFPALIGH